MAQLDSFLTTSRWRETLIKLGACGEDSGNKVKGKLNSNQCKANPAIPKLLGLFVHHGSEEETKDAADRTSC